MTLYTEDEARTKWCPLARKPGGHNRNADGDKVAPCIASACMAWRWGEIKSALPEHGGWRGRCGAFGKIEP